MPAERRRFWSLPLAAPRFAAAWLAYAAMRTLVLLPLERQLAIGRGLGRIAHRVMGRRRRIAERNIELCMPELSPAERAALVERHFEALGASLAETAMGWFGPVDEIKRRVTIRGEEHLKSALERGRGVILYSAHFTPLEFGFPALRPLCPRITGMYKDQRNPVINRVMARGRNRNVDETFAKDNVRAMIRNLARNSVVWYASDQSYGRKGSALVPFFDVPAMTNTAICRIAARTGAVVLPYFYRRLPGEARYVADILAPLDGFPSDDAAVDLARLNRLLEEYIRLCPEQYLWIHQRFKGRPAPYPDVYEAVRRPA
ncbi:MAG TPA: lipid A biosynthesis lauroyl acyltransferase [Gammaproteobacteria bacterium]